MQVTINGEKRELAESLTIDKLIDKLELANQKIAVELNKEIVRKKDWETISVNNADRIEIVHFVGGGWFKGWGQKDEGWSFLKLRPFCFVLEKL